MTRSAASVRFGQDPAVPTAPSTLCPLPSQPPPSPPALAPPPPDRPPPSFPPSPLLPGAPPAPLPGQPRAADAPPEGLAVGPYGEAYEAAIFVGGLLAVRVSAAHYTTPFSDAHVVPVLRHTLRCEGAPRYDLLIDAFGSLQTTEDASTYELSATEPGTAPPKRHDHARLVASAAYRSAPPPPAPSLPHPSPPLHSSFQPSGPPAPCSNVAGTNGMMPGYACLLLLLLSVPTLLQARSRRPKTPVPNLSRRTTHLWAVSFGRSSFGERTRRQGASTGIRSHWPNDRRGRGAPGCFC